MVKKSDKCCERIWEKEKLASDNSMKLQFRAVPENESFARVVVAAFMAQTDPVLEELDDVKTAVSEAVTNCIIHGYENSHNGEIYLECFRKDRDLYIIIEDFGVGMEDVKKAMEPLYTSKPDMERSGMGFAFMEAFMDRLYVESKPQIGTKIYMSKRIGDK